MPANESIHTVFFHMILMSFFFYMIDFLVNFSQIYHIYLLHRFPYNVHVYLHTVHIKVNDAKYFFSKGILNVKMHFE